MSIIRIAAIVEGDGEAEAVPVLIRRHAELARISAAVQVRPVIRCPASRLLRPGEMERTVELSARKLQGPGGVFVLLDSDDACPAQLGPALLARIRLARRDLPTSLVLAHREFEAWFLGSASSLAGRRGLPEVLPPHPDPETVRGCKEWLSARMPRGSAYNEVEDQPALTAVFDLLQASTACPSFEKCSRELFRLLREVAAVTPGFQGAEPGDLDGR